MHISRLLISHRGIIVTLCFGVWIGAAGLICRSFVTRPIDGDENRFKLSSPAQVVRAESGIMPTRVALAER
jgi:hypothetical protein